MMTPSELEGETVPPSQAPSRIPSSGSISGQMSTGSLLDSEHTNHNDTKDMKNIKTTAVTDLETGTIESSNQEEPHHIFSRSKKWRLVYLVSLAGSFSPLSSNIYFPAIDTISHDLHTSASMVALTVTVYMIVQGVAPSLFGAVSDGSGRRLAFALTLIIYTLANLALAFTKNYPMLMALRGVQALGSSATISISAGVIADIAAPSERGGFMGANAGIRMMGQAVGPIIGGLLNSMWGFKSIFWLLFVMSFIVLLLLLIFLPETQRSVAGNGSIPLKGIYKPWYYYIREPKEWANTTDIPTTKLTLFSWRKCVDPLTHIFNKDIFTLLSWGALVYTIWSMVTSSTTTTLLKSFPFLTQWQIGLCFLPNGLGCVLGSITTGRLMDRTFKQVEQDYKAKRGLKTLNLKNEKEFPFERARLALMPYFSGLFIFAMGLYGPSFELNDLESPTAANLAAPLILQFIIAFTATAIFNMNSTMLVDCFPNGSAGATATNNLVRCLLGAAGVSVIQPLIDTVKVRNAFIIMTCIAIAFSPLVWVQWKYGKKWRLAREAKKGENGAEK